MSTYRKKPVEIEAVLISDLPKLGLYPDWLTEAIDAGDVIDEGGGYLIIETLEGRMRADWTDYIIRGVKGELYPCKPDIFAATYESVGGSPVKQQ